jgi:D-3-phosphoglycerate dehydrogenase
MTKVLISDAMDPRAAAIFRERGIEVDEITGQTPDELAAIIGDYDGLAIRSSTKVTAKLLDHASRLKVVGRAGIGVDNVDLPAATARGVVVMNTPFGNSITTAEHAIALMFALARQLPEADASTQAGKWEKNRFMGVEVTGKTLGLIGAGNIGSIVAARALGLKMKVVAFDPFLTPERAVEMGVEKADLDTLLGRADFITLHTPLTDQTRGILSREALGKTKPGVRIINCARGGLIDEAALKEALDSGQIGGAALDVFETEPAKNSPLFGTPEFISTPHPWRIDQRSAGQRRNPGRRADERLPVAWRRNQRDQQPSLTPRSAHASSLIWRWRRSLDGWSGRSSARTFGRSRRGRGAAAQLNQKPITGAVLAGLMGTYSQTVNMVNAPSLAKERGLDVTEIRHDREGDYHTLLRVTVGTKAGDRSVAGTLFGNKAPRLVDIFGVEVEAELVGNMIYLVNTDAPGFIGKLGTTLGEAESTLLPSTLAAAPKAARPSPGLDRREVPPSVLAELCAIEACAKWFRSASDAALGNMPDM